ncbi:MAG: ATP-binding protein [Pseudothermotoga sp.]
MYFSLTPKSSREELYDREKELEDLTNYVQTGRIVLITGIRRVGKTSLLKVFLEQMKQKRYHTVMVDCRVYDKINTLDRNGFEKKLISEFDRILKVNMGVLKVLSKVNVAGVELDFEKLREKRNLLEYLETLDRIVRKKNSKLLVAFDEAQILRLYGRGGKELLNLMAHAYDNLEGIVFILTGSEVGVLHDFLNLQDADSPLFGRYVHEVFLERFTREQSLDLLIKGFEQINIKPDADKIEKAVDVLDGIVGYLSMYGYAVYTSRDWQKALEETQASAVKIVNKELNSLKMRSENYIHVLKAISLGAQTFTQIKDVILAKFGPVNDQTLTNNLNSLQKMGFVEATLKDGKKVYQLPDPMLHRALLS